MIMNLSQDKALRLTAQALTVLLVLAVVVAAMLYIKLGELESSASQSRAEFDKANQAAGAARKKLQDDLKSAGEKLAALERQQNDANQLKALLAKAEPQIAAVLNAVAGAKTSKPEARAAALTGLGVIGQIARGRNDETALANLDRALAIDKTNCVAGLAVNLGGVKTIDVAPDCQGLLPSAPPASAAAAENKPEAAPAGAAGKAAQGAGKS